LMGELDSFVFRFDRESGSVFGTLRCLTNFFAALLTPVKYPYLANKPEIAQAPDPTHESCVQQTESHMRKHCDFHSPASEAAISESEDKLGVEFPGELKELLRISNGIEGPWSAQILLSADEIVSKNLEMRSTEMFGELYLTFDQVLFFGEEGNGDLYYCRIIDGKADGKVFEWDHECDDRICVAQCVSGFYQQLAECWDEDNEGEVEDEKDEIWKS
ncbi:MAG: SMI1/KNR4 family protein, partial [Terriglobales bacterium]